MTHSLQCIQHGEVVYLGPLLISVPVTLYMGLGGILLCRITSDEMQWSFSKSMPLLVLIVFFCISGPTDLRLVGGYSRCSGRVEVLHNQQWGTVCNNMWDLMDAEVVCRQVGCGTPLAARFGEPVEKEPGPVWLDEVKCTGTEAALSGCSAKRWGVDYCHYEHAGVLCSGNPYSCGFLGSVLWGAMLLVL